MIVATSPPAAAYAATDAPPLPELSSSTSRTPCCRSSESITDVPRSLKLQVGLNHSHLKWTSVPLATRRASSGVQPSPRLMGWAHARGNAAAYRQIERSDRSI